jgi:hypothetical protein
MTWYVQQIIVVNCSMNLILSCVYIPANGASAWATVVPTDGEARLPTAQTSMTDNRYQSGRTTLESSYQARNTSSACVHNYTSTVSSVIHFYHMELSNLHGSNRGDAPVNCLSVMLKQSIRTEVHAVIVL